MVVMVAMLVVVAGVGMLVVAVVVTVTNMGFVMMGAMRVILINFLLPIEC